MAMIDKKELLDGDGMVRWEHETAYGSMNFARSADGARQKIL